MSTLRFAKRAKSIKNVAIVNRSNTAAELQALVKQMKKELKEWEQKYSDLALGKGRASLRDACACDLAGLQASI